MMHIMIIILLLSWEVLALKNMSVLRSMLLLSLKSLRTISTDFFLSYENVFEQVSQDCTINITICDNDYNGNYCTIIWKLSWIFKSR